MSNFLIFAIVFLIIGIGIYLYFFKNNKKEKKQRFTAEDKAAVELIKVLADVMNDIDDFIKG